MRPIAALLGLCVLGAGTTVAQAPDPHRVYEEKCAACHAAHAGDFAREALTFSDGVLVGRVSGRPVRDYLEAGHGRLTAAEITALMAQFNLIHGAGGVFRDKCRICHERAVALARDKLILKDGRPAGRYTGRDIAAFLRRHGRLTSAEIDTIVKVLTRALETRDQGG